MMALRECYFLATSFFLNYCCWGCPKPTLNTSDSFNEHSQKATIEDWARELRRALQDESGHQQRPSTVLRHVLLYEENVDDFDECDLSPKKWLIMGVPRRPLYKELAWRLFHWSQREQMKSGRDGISQLFVPAQDLGFQERATKDLSPPPKSMEDICRWIRQASEEEILRLLGMRCTVGTVCDTRDPSTLWRSICPPRKTLLEAADMHHGNLGCQGQGRHVSLTVAARARAKHAHRGKERFFGVVKGNAQDQNDETRTIVQYFLANAIWINIHKFGGLGEGQVTVELRVASGYGARWIVECKGNEDEDSSHFSAPMKSTIVRRGCEVKFRGFLEPQLSDGHENKWRH